MMVDLAELVSDDPFERAAERTRRSVQAPGRHNEPQPEGVPPTLGGIAASAVDPFGIPSGIAGEFSPELRDKWRGQYEGEIASQLIGGAVSGGPIAKGIGAVARPAIEAIRAHKIIGPTVAGAATVPMAASGAGVQSERTAESFEVPLPEPDPNLVKEHNEIQDKIGPVTASFEAKLQQLETAFQQRATAKDARGQGLYPTTRARELDAAQHEKAREALRAQWKEQVEPLREEAKEIATRIRWQQENQKKERQAQAKAEADMQAAKEARERPLVEQYPALLALPYLGGIYSAGVTYNARRQAISNYNAWVKQAEEQLKSVDKLVSAAEKTGKRVARPATETIEREKQVLGEFAGNAPGAKKAATSTGFLPAAGSGALIASELAMAPYLIDWATQEPESAAGKEARQRLATLEGWMKTSTSALAGITGAGIGATAPTPKIGQFPMERAKVMSQPGGYANAPAVQPRQPAGSVGLPPAQFSKDAAKARQKTSEESLRSIEQNLGESQKFHDLSPADRANRMHEVLRNKPELRQVPIGYTSQQIQEMPYEKYVELMMRGQSLERQVLERGRSGRPTVTEPLKIGSEEKVLEAGRQRTVAAENKTGFEREIDRVIAKNNLPMITDQQMSKNIQSRIRQIEYDRKLSGWEKGDSYALNGELVRLRSRLKELTK